MGFCVASTKNGFSSGYFFVPTVTCFSCIASSNAACVFGGVRLISSASTMLAKIGPGTKTNCLRPVCGSSWMISVPVMSEGIRSGVNWMRFEEMPTARATVVTSRVLASPGTPIRSAWLWQKMHWSVRSTSSCWPTITLWIS